MKLYISSMYDICTVYSTGPLSESRHWRDLSQSHKWSVNDNTIQTLISQLLVQFSVTSSFQFFLLFFVLFSLSLTLIRVSSTVRAFLTVFDSHYNTNNNNNNNNNNDQFLIHFAKNRATPNKQTKTNTNNRIHKLLTWFFQWAVNHRVELKFFETETTNFHFH